MADRPNLLPTGKMIVQRSIAKLGNDDSII